MLVPTDYLIALWHKRLKLVMLPTTQKRQQSTTNISANVTINTSNLQYHLLQQKTYGLVCKTQHIYIVLVLSILNDLEGHSHSLLGILHNPQFSPFLPHPISS